MITQTTIGARARVYNQEIRRLGFQKTHQARGVEKEKAMVAAATAFLSKFFWEMDSDGVMRVKYHQKE